MTVNVPLMLKTMEHIRNHPDEWNQGTWIGYNACGTTACFAGRALILAGRDLAAIRRGMGFEYCAATELGLTYHQGAQLFYGGNDLEDLELFVKLIISGEKLPDLSISSRNFHHSIRKG